MASEQITQDALNIMLQDGETKDNLKHVLSGVLENVEARAVSEQIKAKNGSGNPEGGVIEYKRFVNAELKDKGTARTAGKGDPVKAKPVKVVIDTDKEIVEELQGKDVKLYGIDGMAERRKVNHQSAIIRYLDREFFAKVTEGTEVTPKDNVQDTIDDLLGRARTLKNDFIDGIESDLLVIVVNSTYRKAMKKILDELPNGTDPKEQAIGMYDSVRVYESNRLPTDVEAVVMMDGAIAQPYYVSEYSAEKVPFDDAVALEDYLYKGTKALMEDTIFYVKKKVSLVTNENVTIPSQDTELYGKKVLDMIGTDVKVDENGNVTGTFHKVTGYTGFNSSNVTEQSGYFFPFSLEKTGTTMTFKKNGTATKENIPFEKDNVFRVTKTAKFEVLVDDENVVTLTFNNAIFE